MQLYRNSIHNKLFSTVAISTVLILLVYTPISPASEQESIATLRQMGKAFSYIAREASPAVVGVQSERPISQSSLFGEDLYERFFGGPQRRGPGFGIHLVRGLIAVIILGKVGQGQTGMSLRIGRVNCDGT